MTATLRHADCIPTDMLEGVGAGVERYMNLLSARQKLVASNIANADTPGYKTKDVDFQTELANQMGDQSPSAIEVSGPQNEKRRQQRRHGPRVALAG